MYCTIVLKIEQFLFSLPRYFLSFWVLCVASLSILVALRQNLSACDTLWLSTLNESSEVTNPFVHEKIKDTRGDKVSN